MPLQGVGLGVLKFKGCISGAFLLSYFFSPLQPIFLVLPCGNGMCLVSRLLALQTEPLLSVDTHRRQTAPINQTLDFIRVFM